MLLSLPSFATAALTALSCGQPLPGTMEWFADMLLSANERAQVREVYIECTKREWPIDGDAADFEALRQRVEGLPEHPDRRAFERFAAQIEKNGFSWRYRIWFESDRRWRISVDTDDPESVWTALDTAMDRDGTIWRILKGQLQLFSVNAIPAGMDPGSEVREVEWFTNRFLSSGFFAATDALSSRLDGREWIGVAANPPGTMAWRFTGEIERDAGTSDPRLRVDTRTIVRSDRSELIGSETRYQEWSRVEVLDILVPRTIESRRADGRLSQSWRLIDFRRLELDEIGPLVRTPEPIAGADPIRDLGDLVELVDYRSGGARIFSSAIGENIDGVPRHRTVRGSGAPYWAGWTLAGLLVAALLWIRIRRV